jgi:predicted ABC-type ATPase
MLNNQKPTLYLVRGIPGAGKSEFAKVLWFGLNEGAAIYEADDFFNTKEGYKFDPSKLHKAHAECQEHVKFVLENGNDVIVSNTSTTEKEVETYRKIAEEGNANFVSLIVENRHGCANIHNVPEDNVQQMKLRFSVKL